MKRSNQYYLFQSRTAVAKVVEDTRAAVQRSKQLLVGSTVNTFLGRATHEPFFSSDNLDLRDGGVRRHAAPKISTLGAGVPQSGGADGPRPDAAGTAKDGVGV